MNNLSQPPQRRGASLILEKSLSFRGLMRVLKLLFVFPKKYPEIRNIKFGFLKRELLALNNIIVQNKICAPDQILNKLDQVLRKMLKSKSTSVRGRDGHSGLCN